MDLPLLPRVINKKEEKDSLKDTIPSRTPKYAYRSLTHPKPLRSPPFYYQLLFVINMHNLYLPIILVFGVRAFSPTTTTISTYTHNRFNISPTAANSSSSSSSSSTTTTYDNESENDGPTNTSSSDTHQQKPALDSTRIISSAIYSHHTAIKVRNIENAIKFYSLLGFHVETKFVAGPARCAWLLHESEHINSQPTSLSSRIELLEVPSYMLNESEGKIKRAIDLTKREELLGLNHLALDVTGCIPRPNNDGGATEEGTACALYQLQEWMDDLNTLSIDKFGKSLRVALSPTKRIVGTSVYEMAFIYDADGSLIELLNHSGTLQQEISDGWQPWDGLGFRS